MTDTHLPTSDEEKTTENAGQSTTAEEATEAVAGVDGHVDESDDNTAAAEDNPQPPPGAVRRA